MSKEQEIVEKLLSFAFAMSENMIGLTKGNYDEKTFIKKTYEYLQKYTIDRNEQKTVKQSLKRLEEIDNAEPSAALECLEDLYCNPEDYRSNDRAKDYEAIKSYILKTQESKQYLKWEDLDFKKEEQIMKVLLNGKEYRLSYFTDGICKVIDLLTNNGKYQIYRHVDCYSYDVQFFNDLHLERVE